jgi:hypothetical protein
MRLFRGLILSVAVLGVNLPGVTHAGGRPAMVPGHAFQGPSNSISTFPTSRRAHRRFDTSLFAGTAIMPWDSIDVVVREVPAGVPVIVRNEPPNQPPVADPKFVFPPAPGAPEPAGSHTVIVQRGSSIEVQSFPPTRSAAGSRSGSAP